MRIKYVGFQHFMLVVAIWMLLCWVFGASAAEEWDAETTARVNLRRNPGSKGVILSIVPKGHRVRIMEKQGLWYKIDAEGDIHGKGWVYAKYIAEMLSKAPKTEDNLQAAAVEMPSGEPIERTHSANPALSVRTPDEKQLPLHTPPPKKAARVDVREQPSIHEEFPPSRDNTGALSRVKIPAGSEPPHAVSGQSSAEARTEDEKEAPLATTKSEKVAMTGNKQYPTSQNELQNMQPQSTAVSQMESPSIGGPIHVAHMRPPQSGIENHPPGAMKKAFSEVPIQGDSIARPMDFPVERKDPVKAKQRKPLEDKEQAVFITPMVEETAKQKMAVSHQRKGSTAKQSTMGLVELALKLMSIALTGLVILFLHRANKIAASHYEALTQFQNRPKSRP